MAGIPNGRGRRQKGAVAEREVAAIFRAAGFTCDRTPNSGGLHIPGDLTGIDGFHIEVKRQEVLRIPDWWKQAQIEAVGAACRRCSMEWIGTAPIYCSNCRQETVTRVDHPILAFRRSNERWRGMIDLDVLAALMQRAI